MDLAAVRTTLATAVATISGLNCTTYVPDSIVTPAFYLADDITIEFDGAFGRGLDTITLTGVVLANTAIAKDGQSKLDSYLAGSGSTSIKAVLHAIRPTGSGAISAVANDLNVIEVRSYRRYEHAGETYYGAEFEIRVWGRGVI
jgi:hypothetical protein